MNMRVEIDVCERRIYERLISYDVSSNHVFPSYSGSRNFLKQFYSLFYIHTYHTFIYFSYTRRQNMLKTVFIQYIMSLTVILYLLFLLLLILS